MGPAASCGPRACRSPTSPTTEFGFVHVRIQGWIPYECQVYINGREWLARQLDRAGIGYVRYENSLLAVDDLEAASELCERFAQLWTVEVPTIRTPNGISTAPNIDQIINSQLPVMWRCSDEVRSGCWERPGNPPGNPEIPDRPRP